MKNYILKKIISVIIVLIGASFFTYAMMMFAPGDPALEIAIARYGGESLAGSQSVEWIRQQEGLDKPFLYQYFFWIKNVIRLDLSTSLVEEAPVSELIYTRFFKTLKLACAAIIIAVLVSIPLGIIAGFRQGTWMDFTGVSIGVAGVSMPNYWLGLVLIIIFSVKLKWLPCFGYGNISHIILPAITLGTGITAYTTRILRSAIIESIASDYILALKARGIGNPAVLGIHIFKNAMIPVVTIMGLEFGMILEGAVMTETVFSWPGIGDLIVTAVSNRDYPLIQGLVLFIAAVFVIINLVTDILYKYLDPRIQL